MFRVSCSTVRNNHKKLFLSSSSSWSSGNLTTRRMWGVATTQVKSAVTQKQGATVLSAQAASCQGPFPSLSTSHRPPLHSRSHHFQSLTPASLTRSSDGFRRFRPTSTSTPSFTTNKLVSVRFHATLAATHQDDHVDDDMHEDGRDSSSGGSQNNVIPFLLADIGEGIKEVELLQWHVEPGDTVHEFDLLCQVQSDKATVDITSRFAGRIVQLAAPVGEMIQVGTPLLFLETQQQHYHQGGGPANNAHVETAAESPSSSSHELSPDIVSPPHSLAEQMAVDAVSSQHEERLRIPSVASHYNLDHHDASSLQQPQVLTSPAVRKLAADHNLNLNIVRGTGPSGRILKHDVLQFLKQQGLMEDSTASLGVPVSAAGPPVSTGLSTTATQSIAVEATDEIVQLKGYHRYMVQSMTQALEIPHMTLGDEVVLDEIMALRQRIKKKEEEQHKNEDPSKLPNVSMLSFMLKACSLALLEFPMLNASIHSLEHCELQLHRHHHIGVAMDTPRGLVVPAVQNVETKSLLEIQMELDHLKAQARSGQVNAAVLNPTFTLSNVGALGVGQSMSAVLASPQVAMGAVGRVQRVPRFISNESLKVQAVHIASVSWTGDHRFLDGGQLAQFHKRFATFLQDPVQMLLRCK